EPADTVACRVLADRHRPTAGRHAKIEQMAHAVTGVAAPGFDAVAPRIEIELRSGRKLYVASSESDALAVDAGKIGFAADARADAAIEHMIPYIQLPDGGGIDGGNKIALAGGTGDDEFVGADSVERRHRVVGKRVGRASGPAGRVVPAKFPRAVGQ